MSETETNPADDAVVSAEQALNPASDTTQTSNTGVQFFPVSEGKLITMYLASFGMYAIYWFYKNWSLQQDRMDKKISPVWRSIFSIFFTHSLFKRIDQQAIGLDKKHRFNANWYATLFVAAIVVSNLLDNLTMGSGMFTVPSENSLIIISLVLFFVSIFPLVKVQATVNRINNDMLGYLNHKYSLWNYVLIILGIIAWLLLALGMLTESLTV